MRRDDLYLADEAFLTGTAAEVVPIASVDDVSWAAVRQVRSRCRSSVSITRPCVANYPSMRVGSLGSSLRWAVVSKRDPTNVCPRPARR